MTDRYDWRRWAYSVHTSFLPTCSTSIIVLIPPTFTTINYFLSILPLSILLPYHIFTTTTATTPHATDEFSFSVFPLWVLGSLGLLVFFFSFGV